MSRVYPQHSHASSHTGHTQVSGPPQRALALWLLSLLMPCLLALLGAADSPQDGPQDSETSTDVAAAAATSEQVEAAAGSDSGAAAEVPSIEAADPMERSVDEALAKADEATGIAGKAGVPSYVDPATGEHPVFKLRPEPFSDSEAQLVTLDDLLNMALENNAALQTQNYNIEKGHYSVDQTYYAFDPQLAAGFSYSRRGGAGTTVSDGSGGTTFIPGTTSNSASLNFDYTLPREYGDSFNFGYDLSGSKLSGGSGSSSSGGTNYSSGISLGYNRPLGRGAGRHLGRIPRYLASNNLALSYEQLDDQTRNLKRSILDLYYQAVSARQAIDVRQRNLELALQQLDRAVERYKVGLGIQADVLQAENNVLNQRSALLSTEKGYQDLLDQLTAQIGLPQEYHLAVDSGEALLDTSATLPEDFWELVRSNSFDLKSLNTQLANQRLQREQIEDRLKPQLDLSVSYGRSGNEDKLGSTVGSLSNDNLQLGLNWRTTKGERETKASLAQNQLDLASLELDMQQTELELKARVRERQRDLETKAEQITLAESNLAVTQQTYEITVERNNVGLATTIDVVEAQERVLDAELALLNARVAYQQTYRELMLLAGLI